MQTLSALDFLSNYSDDVKEMAEKVSGLIFSKLPEIKEVVDVPARIIGYGFGPKYADSICVLIPSKKGLKLGFYKGSELPDPKNLLTGTGKMHRYIELKPDTNESDISNL